MPEWVEALAICALVIEVYVRWKQDPERPPFVGEGDD